MVTLKQVGSAGLALVGIAGVAPFVGTAPALAAPECQGSVNACIWWNGTLMHTHTNTSGPTAVFANFNGVDNDNNRNRFCAYSNNNWTGALVASVAPGNNYDYNPDRQLQSVKWSTNPSDCP